MPDKQMKKAAEALANAADKQKADAKKARKRAERLKTVEERVAKMEKKVAGLADDLGVVKGETTGLSGKMKKLTTSVSAIQGEWGLAKRWLYGFLVPILVAVLGIVITLLVKLT